jgi:filamentous hemagglutinin
MVADLDDDGNDDLVIMHSNGITTYGVSLEKRESLFIGPSGHSLKLATTFEILPDGARRLTTIFPFRTGVK